MALLISHKYINNFTTYKLVCSAKDNNLLSAPQQAIVIVRCVPNQTWRKNQQHCFCFEFVVGLVAGNLYVVALWNIDGKPRFVWIPFNGVICSDGSHALLNALIFSSHAFQESSIMLTKNHFGKIRHMLKVIFKLTLHLINGVTKQHLYSGIHGNEMPAWRVMMH